MKKKLSLKHKCQKLVLALKAKVYQWTGLYLAQEEERRMLRSSFFWKQFNSFPPKNNLTDKEKQDFVVAVWKAHRGFHQLSKLYVLEILVRAKAKKLTKNVNHKLSKLVRKVSKLVKQLVRKK
jgi:hypothetical protein